MKKPTLDITLDKHGRMTVHISGSGGKACLKLADMIREIVGKEESRRLTSEYHGTEGDVRIDAAVSNTSAARVAT